MAERPDGFHGLSRNSDGLGQNAAGPTRSPAIGEDTAQRYSDTAPKGEAISRHASLQRAGH